MEKIRLTELVLMHVHRNTTNTIDRFSKINKKQTKIKRLGV